MLKFGAGGGDEDVLISFPYTLRRSLVTDSGPRNIVTLLMRKKQLFIETQIYQDQYPGLQCFLDKTENKDCIKLSFILWFLSY